MVGYERIAYTQGDVAHLDRLNLCGTVVYGVAYGIDVEGLAYTGLA